MQRESFFHVDIINQLMAQEWSIVDSKCFEHEIARNNAKERKKIGVRDKIYSSWAHFSVIIEAFSMAGKKVFTL